MDNVVFIDGNYLYRLSQRMGIKIDFSAFREGIVDYFEGPTRIYYYYCTPFNAVDNHVAAKPLIDWLGYNGYIIRYNSVPQEHFENESRCYAPVALASYFR